MTKIRTRIKTKRTKRDPKATMKVDRNVKVQKLLKSRLMKKEMKTRIRMKMSRLCRRIMTKTRRLMCLPDSQIKGAFLWMRDSSS